MSDVKLYLGDCLELMKELDDASVDAVITDPPYGVEFAEWDNSIPLWLDRARYLSKRVIFTTAPTTQWDYPRPDWVACWYRTAAQSRNAQGGFNHWTPVLSYGDAKFQVDTFYSHGLATGQANKGIDHPSPKDVKMVMWLIENATNEGDTILDPFMGSGTTGVACVKLNRNFIGMEIHEPYFEIAQQRIQNARADMGQADKIIAPNVTISPMF